MPKSKSKITQWKSSTSPHPPPSENMSDSEDLEVDIPGEDLMMYPKQNRFQLPYFAKCHPPAAVG